jgi:hypothetical protein
VCTASDKAAYQLVNIVLQSKIPLYFYDILLKWGDAAAKSGLVGEKAAAPRKRQKAMFTQLVDHYTTSKVKMVRVVLESDNTARHVECHESSTRKGTRKKAPSNTTTPTPIPQSSIFVDVPVFEFRAQLMDLLSDGLFHDIDNLVVNRTSDITDLFHPYRVVPGITQLDEVMTGSWYQQVVRFLPKFDPTNEFILPIITYGDGTPVDKMGKHSVEPWIFTTPLINQSARNLPYSWRMMGMRPDIDCGSKLANTRSDGNRKGRSMRNGHACMEVLLRELFQVMKEGFPFNLRIGNHIRKVTIRPVHAFTIGDAKSGDFIAGRYGGHNTKRMCRACYCTYEESEEHNHPCKWVEIEHVLPLLQITRHFHDPLTYSEQLQEDALSAAKCLEVEEEFSNGSKTVNDIMLDARKKLETISQHESISPFLLLNRHPGDEHGVFRSTPTDYMHAFLLGVLKYSIENILQEFTVPNRADIDCTVAYIASNNRQTAKNNYPRANLVRGVTNLAKVTADEWAGLAFYLYLYLLSPAGEKIAIEQYGKSKFPKVNEDPTSHHRDVLRTLETLLVFEAWLKVGPFGTAGETSDSKCCSEHIHQRTSSLMLQVSDSLPRQHYDQKEGDVTEIGNGWKLQKFHEHLHLSWLIKAFGHPRNFNAAQGESHLKHFAKLPAATVQKTSPQILVKQMAERAQHHIAIGNFFRIQNVPPLVQTYKDEHQKQALVGDVEGPSPSDDESSTCSTKSGESSGDHAKKESATVSQLSSHLWTMTITRNDSSKTSSSSYRTEFPSPVSKHENAIYPQMEKYLSDIYSKQILEENDIHEIVVRGYSILRRIGCPRLRSHPSFSNGRCWHDWVMAYYEKEEGDHDPPGPRTKECKNRCAERSRLFGLGATNSRVDNMQGSSIGTAHTLAGVWPAKVLGIMEVSEIRGTALHPRRSASFCRLLIHCAKKRMSSPHHISLVAERWRMELDPLKCPSLYPKLRLLDPSSIATSVFVYDPLPSHPFVLDVGDDPDRQKYVYSVYDRYKVWPSQFLMS